MEALDSRFLPASVRFAMHLLAQLYEIRWLLLTALIGLYVANKYRKYDRLRHFDGPFGTGWSELWHTQVILGLRSHLAYKNVNDLYGSCFDQRSDSATLRANAIRPYRSSRA